MDLLLKQYFIRRIAERRLLAELGRSAHSIAGCRSEKVTNDHDRQEPTRCRHPRPNTAYELARYARQHAEAIEAEDIQAPTDWHADG
jgi:hypothetical protein